MSDNLEENSNEYKAEVTSTKATQSQTTEGNEGTEATSTEATQVSTKSNNKQGLLGLGLVGIGLLAVLTNVGDEAGFLWTGMISAIMFFAYYRTKAYGLLIPACILAGVTAGIIFEMLSPVEGVFLLGLGGGFVAIDRIQQEKSRWPLYPGIVLLAIGTVITIQTLFNNMLFAIMLIVVGAFLLLRNRQVLDSMVDIKTNVDIRVGDNGKNDAKADLKAEGVKSFASDEVDASTVTTERKTKAETAVADIMADDGESTNGSDSSETKSKSKTKVVDIDSDDSSQSSSDEVIEIEASSTDKNVKDLDDAVSNIKKAVDKIVEDANLPKDDDTSI